MPASYVLPSADGLPSVLFDHGAFCRQQHGGVSKYFYSLAASLRSELGVDASICPLLHSNTYLERPGAPVMHSWRVPDFKGDHRVLPVVNDWLGQMVDKRRFDIVHMTYPTKRRPKPRSVAVAITVHDMIHELFPQYYTDQSHVERKRYSITYSDVIFTISERSKLDILDRYNLDPAKVAVVYHGVAPLQKSDTAPLIDRPYFLYVGRRDRYKDFMVLAKAFADARGLASDFMLLAFGGGAPSQEELSQLDRLGLASRVAFFGGDDEQLWTCYRYATAFVFPSRYEGFGMPLLEAMQAGCPLICSDGSCFPEIAGEAAWYFEAGRSDALAATLENFLVSCEERVRRVALGRARAAGFTWRRCAEQTLDHYCSVL